MLSLGSLDTGFFGLSLTSALLAYILVESRINILDVPKELKLFPWFLLFIFITRSLSTEGEELFNIYGITPTLEGSLLGIQICWRLIIVILLSLAFISSTTSAEIKAAIEFYFRRVPFIPEKRLSTMLGLLLRFIPIIMNQMQETMDAQRARGIEMRRNPIYRLIKLTIPVLRRIFRSGDQLSTAMASRCYTENRTGPSMTSSSIDWTALVVLSVFCLLINMENLAIGNEQIVTTAKRLQQHHDVDLLEKGAGPAGDTCLKFPLRFNQSYIKFS